MTVQQEQHLKTTQNIPLGTIGEHKSFLLDRDYNHTALPKFQEPIKLKVHSVPFNKSKLKAFENAKRIQNQEVALTYIDSVKTKSRFLKLEIADRVGVLNSLKADENNAIFQFLQTTTNAHLISTISVVFDTDTAANLSTAQEVYLEHTGINNYVIKTYLNKVEQQSVYFKEGVVFGYQTSQPCWKENRNHQFEIIDLVESNEKCPANSNKEVKKVKKKINYYKL